MTDKDDKPRVAVIGHHLPGMALAATLMGLAAVGTEFTGTRTGRFSAHDPDFVELNPPRINLDTADERRKIERNAALGMQYSKMREDVYGDMPVTMNDLLHGDYSEIEQRISRIGRSDVENRARAILAAEDHGTHADKLKAMRDWQALRPKRKKFKHNRRG